MSKGKDFYYNRYPALWLSGVMVLTAEERGVYDTIMELIYDRGAPIPDAPKDLARMCGLRTPKRFELVRDRLIDLGKVVRRDGCLTVLRCEREIQKRSRSSRKMDSESDPGSLFSNGLDGPIVRVKSQDKKTSHLTEEWRPDAAGLAYAADKSREAYGQPWAASKVEEMIESFRDHHLRNRNNYEWGAAWRTWVRNEIKFDRNRRGSGGSASAPRRGPTGGRPPSIAEQLANNIMGGDDGER